MLLLAEQSLTDGHEKKIVMHYTLYIIIGKAMFYISKRYIGSDNLGKNLNISERKIKDGHSI